MSNVVGYVRVSTSTQAEIGLSIEAQRAKIEAYCVCHDLTLTEIIVDAGESAKNLARPGMQLLLAKIKTGRADGVVFVKIDRLTRSMKDLHHLLNGALSTAEIHSVTEPIDTSSAVGRLVLNLLTSVAEWEREAISERTSTALQAKKAKGERTGNPPYGWRREGGSWVEEPREQRVIELVKELRHRGYSYRAIKADLEERQILNRSGRANWSLGLLSRVIS